MVSVSRLSERGVREGSLPTCTPQNRDMNYTTVYKQSVAPFQAIMRDVKLAIKRARDTKYNYHQTIKRVRQALARRESAQSP